MKNSRMILCCAVLALASVGQLTVGCSSRAPDAPAPHSKMVGVGIATTTTAVGASSSGHHVHIGNPKPGPGGGGYPSNPAFCYIQQVVGPFNSSDDYFTIDVDSNGWYADFNDSQTGLAACTQFSELTNAGNATSEGYNIQYTITGTGSSFHTASIPSSAPVNYRNPDFCPLTTLAGIFEDDPAYCSYLAAAEAIPEQGANADIVTLGARVNVCNGNGFGGTYASYCQTKWSGISNIQYSLVDYDFTGSGQDLIPKSEGTCWINYASALYTSSDAILIEEVTVGSDIHYQGRTTGSAVGHASCIRFDQTQ